MHHMNVRKKRERIKNTSSSIWISHTSGFYCRKWVECWCGVCLCVCARPSLARAEWRRCGCITETVKNISMFLGLLFQRNVCVSKHIIYFSRYGFGNIWASNLRSRGRTQRRGTYHLLHLRCGGEGCRFKTKRLNLEKIKKWQAERGCCAAFYVQCEKNECKSFVPARSRIHTASSVQRAEGHY